MSGGLIPLSHGLNREVILFSETSVDREVTDTAQCRAFGAVLVYT